MTGYGDDHRRYPEFAGATAGQVAAEGNGAQDCQNRSARAADQMSQQVVVRADEARPSVRIRRLVRLRVERGPGGQCTVKG